MSGNADLRQVPKWYILLAVCLAALTIRPPLTVVGPLASLIASQTGLSATAIGGLTTLTLLVFVLASPCVSRVAPAFGDTRLVALGLGCVALGSLVRWYPSLLAVYIGTALVAAGIAVANVLLPAIVQQHFLGWIGPVTSLYVTLMTLAGAIGSAVAVPFASGLSMGWQTVIALPGLLALAALLVWLPFLRSPAQDFQREQSRAMVWRVPLAWFVAVFFGLQGMIFYSLIAWMVPMLVEKGLAPEAAGLVLGAFGTIGMLSSVLVPVLATRWSSQRLVAVALGAGQFICALGIYLSSGMLAVAFAVTLGLFTTGAFTLCFVLFAVRARTTDTSASLSGMAQSIGYALAAAGPFLMGALFDRTGSWSSAEIAVIVMTIGTICFGFLAGANRFVDSIAPTPIQAGVSR